ncbi:lipoyl synthase [Candidatus Karelsulcia muelleri]
MNFNNNFNKNCNNKPIWLKVRFNIGDKYSKLNKLLLTESLNTICQRSDCPNIGTCWKHGVLSFLLLGNICTRSCKFCSIKTGIPKKLNLLEPYKIANTIKKIEIKHVVLTSVNRDDLKDLGINLWLKTIREIKKIYNSTIETLIPDFKGQQKPIALIIKEKPEIISHNIETVPRLLKKVRIIAKYERSLSLLKFIKTKCDIRTKTGIMLGLGETEVELINTFKDIRKANIDILTLGQYLSPSLKHYEVKNFITPKKFKYYKNIALNMGFLFVESHPLVRSSYKAYKHIR